MSGLGKMSRTVSEGAEFCASSGDDDRAVGEDGVGEHGVDEPVVGQRRVAEAELCVGRLAQQVARRNPHRRDERGERFPRGRGLQVFDDDRLLAGLPDHRQHVARRCRARG